MSFKDEMDRRARRVLGVTDDSLMVDYNEEVDKYYGGFCDTCSYTETSWKLIVSVFDGAVHPYPTSNNTVSRREFEDMGRYLRLLDEVPDED